MTSKFQHLSLCHRSNRLNSTLSVRIEELNAQISALYVENLRLRASEIALTSQLKKEKERTARVMGDAEAAVRSFSLFSLSFVSLSSVWSSSFLELLHYSSRGESCSSWAAT